MPVTERTDDQILAFEPLEIQLGGKKYSIPVPLLPQSRAWRKKLYDETHAIAQGIQGKTTNGMDEAFFIGLSAVLISFPDKIAEMVRAAAPDVLTEEILNTATEEEATLAFTQIWNLYNPSRGQISSLMSIMRNEALLSALARSTN